MFLAASWCLRKCLWALPIITFVWILLGFVTTYSVAVALNHTFPNFPYISYTGTEVPERGIFTLVAAVSAVFLAANGEMRFLFVRKMFSMHKVSKKWKRTNFAGLVLGLLSAFGLLLVACFQVDSMKPPHYFGAFLCFVIAVVYAWLQTLLTWKIRMYLRDKDWKVHTIMMWVELVNSIVCTLLLVLFCISKAWYKIGRRKGLGTKWDTLRSVFLLSTSTEWLLMVSIAFFLLTFIPCFKMFKKIRIHVTLEDRLSIGSSTENGGVNEEMDRIV